MMAWKKSTLGVGLATLFLVSLVPPLKGAPWLDFGNQRNSVAESHVVKGGKDSVENVPYTISIERYRWHLCGGVIISDSWVLTVAHCIRSGSDGSGPIWAKRIRAGVTRQIPFIGWEGTIHEIEYSTYDSRYFLALIDYDIGVIKVSNKFEFNNRVQAIAVPTVTEAEFIDYKQPAIASGWGRSQASNWFQENDLKSVVLPLVPRDECARRYKGVNWPSWFHPNVTERMICAGGSGTGGICAGDSGGPLVHKKHVIGLTSWMMLDCNDAYHPSVFANVLDKEIRAFIRIHTGI